MYDTELVKDIIEDMITSCNKVLRRCENIQNPDDFLVDETSQILLDSVCMQLIAIGESVKNIDKITHKQLLQQYTEIEWHKIAGIRDILSHHYFDLNAETIFSVYENHMEDLLEVLINIGKQLNKS
jgi:uncharacterized protein with HEPN domain